MLARMQEEETHQARGKLKIFFGATAGVGKTYAMLEAAQARHAEGVDVVVGWVDTHGRAETEALLHGLEILPHRPVAYRGTTLDTFDLDAALARHAMLILVDELAHTNAPGARHPKRWQDVEELLDAGINVYTTMNVQHLESLNDVVAQITGVVVRETIPDSILEQADEVELIDLPPDDLLQRLREGKVYTAQQAAQAIHNFFRKGNLIALRELALRCTADRVDAQMQVYRRDHAIAETWPTTERILVCVSPSPLAARLVRATRRMATRLRAEWLVVYVETPAHLRLPAADRDRVVQTLRLADQLGAETVTLSAQNVSEELLTYARTRNVSKIVVGKPKRPRWREIMFGSVVEELIKHSGDIDVYVINGDQGDFRPWLTPFRERATDWLSYAWGLGSVTLCTVLAWQLFSHLTEANLIMLYLLGVAVVAMRCGRGPAIWASVLSVAAFDFFFVPPYLTFAVADMAYLVTFIVMLFVALVISTLTIRLRQQAAAARQRERRTASLYAMSRELARMRSVDDLLQAAARHISAVFESRVALLLPQASGRLSPWQRGPETESSDAVQRTMFVPGAREAGIAQWVYDHQHMAGLGTTTLPSAESLYLPLVAARGTVGVLGVLPAQPCLLLTPEQVALLETFASQTALALERALLAEEAQQAQLQVETERLRNSLLSSVSHDLRTPLTAITGATSTLLEEDRKLDAPTRHELLHTVHEEADRLNRLVSNLLAMTRLESGAIQVHKEWQPLEEVVGAALTRLDAPLRDRPLTTHLPADLPLVPLDSVLIEQVLINVLDNAIKYTPPGSPLALSAWTTDGAVTVEVADQGPGLSPGDEQRVFEKFYRAQRPGASSGAGLGLTICRGIIEAHGGHIWAKNRSGGGTALRFTLPLTGTPPAVGTELETAHVPSPVTNER
ncbi:MAG TPA: sensor histidine kinase KdpD [Candidatus Saccharimonadia bacterium]|nr:sensor histidine kinase KdpD [Candidatus Saccharimonadia bacterium]